MIAIFSFVISLKEVVVITLPKRRKSYLYFWIGH